MEIYEDEMEYEEDFYNPKEDNRKKYRKRKSHDVNLKRQVIQNGGFYRDYLLKTEKYTGNFTFEPLRSPYIVKIYDSSHCDRYKFAKREAKRAVRRHKNELYNGCLYKKLYDYAWEVD